MPELRNCSRSDEVKVSGCPNSCMVRDGLIANGLSMSITVVRPTSSIAREEYSAGEPANKRYLPLLRKGAARMPAPAAAMDLTASRRDVRRMMISPLLILWQPPQRKPARPCHEKPAASRLTAQCAFAARNSQAPALWAPRSSLLK